MSKRGFGLLLFAILLALGGGWLWLIGLFLGVIGLMMIIADSGSTERSEQDDPEQDREEQN